MRTFRETMNSYLDQPRGTPSAPREKRVVIEYSSQNVEVLEARAHLHMRVRPTLAPSSHPLLSGRSMLARRYSAAQNGALGRPVMISRRPSNFPSAISVADTWPRRRQGKRDVVEAPAAMRACTMRSCPREKPRRSSARCSGGLPSSGVALVLSTSHTTREIRKSTTSAALASSLVMTVRKACSCTRAAFGNSFLCVYALTTRWKEVPCLVSEAAVTCGMQLSTSSVASSACSCLRR